MTIPLVTAVEMRACDQRTITGENLPAPTPGRVLMERAGWGIYAALRQHCAHLGQRPILVFCGPGNNGGDGLVVARHLQAARRAPLVLLLAPVEKLSPDAAEQWVLYGAAGGRRLVVTAAEALGAALAAELRTAGPHPPLVVDALLGTGSRGAPRGLIAAGVERIQALRYEREADVLAIDVPTGVDADTGVVAGEAVEADLTVTMAHLKLGFLFYPGRRHLGLVRCVDIGIPASVTSDVGVATYLMTREEAAPLVPAREADAHKSSVGRVLIVGGSPGLTGAPAMAAEAAVRSGAGLTTVAVPRGLNPSLETKLTEAMTLPCPETAAGGLALAAQSRLAQMEARTEAWALGPGLGREAEAQELVRRLVASYAGPLVVDADGLFALAQQPWSHPRGELPPVLTPHPGEMARLLGRARPPAAEERVELARRYAREHNCVLLLKGVPTLVADPDGEVSVNPTGHAGLAAGGSGDVLTGIVAAFLAQGLLPFDAARLAAYVHGAAADRRLPAEGRLGLSPVDLTAALPATLRELAGATPIAESRRWTSSAALQIP